MDPKRKLRARDILLADINGWHVIPLGIAIALAVLLAMIVLSNAIFSVRHPPPSQKKMEMKIQLQSQLAPRG